MRYTVQENDFGGYRVVIRKAGEDVQIGGDLSHLRNAEIKASRLNGERDDDGTDWAKFYRA